MQKLNNNFLTFYYETFSFLMPQGFSSKEQLVSYRFKNWVLMDSYKHATHLRFILKTLQKLNKENYAQNLKFLFIIDESLFSFFKDFLNNNKYFFTTDSKEALRFLNSNKSQNISSVIYIGFLDNFSENLTRTWECPAFFFTPKVLNKNAFIYYNSLSFQGSILLLKSFLIDVLTTYEKKI